MLNIKKTFLNISSLIREAYKQALWTLPRSGKVRQYLKTHNTAKLHLGAGPNILEGWLNTDLSPQHPDIIFLDVTQPFPFKDGVFDYIFNEHLIEHATHTEGAVMLRECYRVLKPGGKIRVFTPDFDIVLNLRASEKKELQKQYIKWHVDNCLPGLNVYKDIFVINNAFYGFGHKFLYDYETLQNSLKTAGFVDITQYPPGESGDASLKGIDFRAKDEMLKFTGLILEAKRPAV